MEDSISDYLILGNDSLNIYGIYIIQSKGRYHTKEGEWNRKYEICKIST